MFKKIRSRLCMLLNKKIFIRRISQLLSIFLFIFLIYRVKVYPLPEKLPLNIYFKTDGLLAISLTLINLVSFEDFIPAFLMILLIFFVGNFFCFWICPLGGCIDYLNIITRRKFFKTPFSLFDSKKLRIAGTWILFFVLISALFNCLFDFVFVGFVFDPFIILGQAITMAKFWLAFLMLILICSVLYPRLWCNCFCPLGRLYLITGGLLRRIKEKTKK